MFYREPVQLEERNVTFELAVILPCLVLHAGDDLDVRWRLDSANRAIERNEAARKRSMNCCTQLGW